MSIIYANIKNKTINFDEYSLKHENSVNQDPIVISETICEVLECGKIAEHEVDIKLKSDKKITFSVCKSCKFAIESNDSDR